MFKHVSTKSQYKQVNGNFYLHFIVGPSDWSTPREWRMGLDPDNLSRYVLNKQDGPCPPETGYKDYKGGKWVYDYDINVTGKTDRESN